MFGLVLHVIHTHRSNICHCVHISTRSNVFQSIHSKQATGWQCIRPLHRLLAHDVLSACLFQMESDVTTRGSNWYSPNQVLNRTFSVFFLDLSRWLTFLSSSLAQQIHFEFAQTSNWWVPLFHCLCFVSVRDEYVYVHLYASLLLRASLLEWVCFGYSMIISWKTIALSKVYYVFDRYTFGYTF